ncbi:uncharacterized protein LOC106753028 [Vigna radiata var. radiata]|uniref:Uncharacterized protein LOC106753028 n=1 Tax=Vigna radiata var. radiata TaxID=3916 RepID=A0A1S3T952_VIGRR|nr:uncharacterized protein LOC106753028 [Vigna radiata var. radiata]
MPSYAKVLKELLTKKRKYIEKETIEVQGNCSVIIQKLVPPKLQDPRSFTIPCTIGDLEVGRALIDLGSNINLMPLSVLKKIGGLRLKPTKISLLMADGSSKKPYGVVEDIVVQMERLEFLVDFVVMEMKEDENIPIIRGRPFMKTAEVIINVDDGLIMFKDQEEEVIFDVIKDKQIQVKKISHRAASKDALVNRHKATKSINKEELQ